jgi:hypothetical protein
MIHELFNTYTDQQLTLPPPSQLHNTRNAQNGTIPRRAALHIHNCSCQVDDDDIGACWLTQQRRRRGHEAHVKQHRVAGP